jgi:hypothetical protein
MTNGLQTILKETFIPTYRAVHDCVDTGNDLTIIGGDPRVKFPCDCEIRDKYNVKKYFDSTTSNIKDGNVWGVMFTTIKAEINAPVNTTIEIEIEIDHPTLGIINIETIDLYHLKNNITIPYKIISTLYNSDDSDAHLYGFNIWISSNTTCTLKSRSIKVIQ